MIKDNIDNFSKGWFIGNFSPTLLHSENFEVAIKRYRKGDVETSHCHKIATEYTIIVSGVAKMNDQLFYQDDIAIVYPNEYVKFEAITDVVTTVIKTPSVLNDKFIENE